MYLEKLKRLRVSNKNHIQSGRCTRIRIEIKAIIDFFSNKIKQIEKEIDIVVNIESLAKVVLYARDSANKTMLKIPDN